MSVHYRNQPVKVKKLSLRHLQENSENSICIYSDHLTQKSIVS